MRRVLVALADDAPVPVFPLVGAEAAEALDAVRLDSRIRVVDSPRASNVLLLLGRIPAQLLRPAVQVHDQMSRPRATVWWPRGAADRRLTRLFPGISWVEPDGDVAGAVARVHREVLHGERPSDPPVRPDVDPAPWRGVGPYGHGGMGMTGGVPFGRPMATRAPDPDGLELDDLPLRVGPFFPPFPSGLVLEVRLQGDVVGKTRVSSTPLPARSDADGNPFVRALRQPVEVAELERGRARSHLRWLAGALRTQGLPALGERVLRLGAEPGGGTAAEIRSLERLLKRTGSVAWALAGVGPIEADRLSGLRAGPVTRAGGVPEDVRSEDPAYTSLGFSPIVGKDGDAWGRWCQRLAEAAQSLDLAERARDRRTGGVGAVESPRGRLTTEERPTERLLELLPSLLPGQEWGDAVATVVSLDLDLEMGS